MGECVGLLYTDSAFIAPMHFKEPGFAFFFFRGSALLWPFSVLFAHVGAAAAT